MRSIVRQAFLQENIEYTAAIPYEACRVIRPYLVERLGFVPRTAILFLVLYGNEYTIRRRCSGCLQHYPCGRARLR